ncbi:MAG: hypothetical protein R6U91_07725 [Bacillota bacterium]
MLKSFFCLAACFLVLLLAFGCADNEGTVVGEDEIAIEVVNNTEEIMISYVLFYGPDLEEWGEDLLGDEEIPPGEEKIFVMPEGEYTVIPMTYNYYLLPGARNVSDDYILEIGEEGKFPIQVTNAKEETDIGFLYLSPSDSEDWGEDWLGEEVIPAGTTRYFFVEEDVYDLLVLDLEGEPILNKDEIEIDSEKQFTVEE